jgi:hypothetical protein
LGTFPSQEATLQAFADAGAFNESLQRDSHFVFAGGPEPAFPDGPCLETQERLGGFRVVEAADLDVALALAADGSKACRGTVEV